MKNEEVDPEVLDFEVRLKGWVEEAKIELMAAGVGKQRAEQVVCRALDKLVVSD